MAILATEASEDGKVKSLVNLLMDQDKKSLQETNALYDEYIDEWGFLLAAYEGTKALVDWGAIERHERESTDNYNRRKKEAYGPGYSRSVIDLFNFYQFKSPVKRQLDSTGESDEWNDFEQDADREGNSIDDFMMDASKYADILGHVGIMVNMPEGNFQTEAQRKEAKARPYCAMYFPQSILDWKYERTNTGARQLTYLKLLDCDGYYHLWYLDHWEKWEIVQADNKNKDETAQRIGYGSNRLNEIPFVMLKCDKSSNRDIGRSDLTDIARLDVSIVRNLSQGEEIINYGAFPMLMKPYREEGQTAETGDDVGPTAVLGFDPEHPESKPDWLKAEVKDPIEAILKWIERKVDEIYRASNAGGMAGTEIQSQAKSGVALRAEFQLLNGKLIKKSTNNVKAQRRIINYWHLWLGKDVPGQLTIERPKTFEVENLAADLENAMTSKSIVSSTTFRKQLQKLVVRLMLPTADDEVLGSIDKEIDEQKEADLLNPLKSFMEGEDSGKPDDSSPQEE